LATARAPALVAGPEVDASGGWEAAVALAERQRLAVWAAPAAGGSRLGFPERHPQFAGVLPPAIGPLAQALSAHDLVLVAGSPVFPYYPYIPGQLLADGCELVALTSDPGEAARAPMGDAIVGDVGLALARLVELVGDPGDTRPAIEPRAEPGEPDAASTPGRLSGSQAMAALADAWSSEAIAVVETPSSTLALRNRLRISTPGSYYLCASGGLGFGIAAAVGVQLAQPARPVVCVLGEGSAQYAITALWTAAALSVPVTYLVLRNDDYSILKWFSALEQVSGAPGLDLPGLDVAAVARGYGIAAEEVSGREALTEALRAAIGADDGPRLIQVPVAPGMWVQ
ncbi:MAG: thiamine pyrophosphate-dependent enzyme, partial [Solirubrobacteraceae bacterium]